MRPKLILTGDGSHTLLREDLDEPYHSRHGALAESQHVFIRMGLQRTTANPLQLLEVGLGTGLNVLLTVLAATGRRIHMTSLEPCPIQPDLVDQLNYPQLLPHPLEAHSLLRQIHNCPDGIWTPIAPQFQFRRVLKRLETFEDTPGTVDLIYFDAFAPNKQAELWSQASLNMLASLLAPGGLLVTYCARGAFKRDLKAVGLHVETLPGPPGKREMTAAHKPT